MIRLSRWEQVTAACIQFVLYLAFPWETVSRWDVVLCFVTLGVCAVAILGICEWLAEHILGIKIPG